MLQQHQFPFAPVEPPKNKNTIILGIVLFAGIAGICIYNHLKLKNDAKK